MSRFLAIFVPCWCCKENFLCDPDTVVSVWIDADSQLPPDLGGDPDRAIRMAICDDCVDKVNSLRTAQGIPVIPTLMGDE